MSKTFWCCGGRRAFGTAAGGEEVTLVSADVAQVAAVAVLAAAWFAADGYSRRLRRRTVQVHRRPVQRFTEREVVDASALSASDD
jgi:hypothetical protein